MLNRTNRTLSANLNRLNLGTRSLAIAANVNNGDLTQRIRHTHRAVMREGLAVIPSAPITIRREVVPVVPGLPSVSPWLVKSCVMPTWGRLAVETGSEPGRTCRLGASQQSYPKRDSMRSRDERKPLDGKRSFAVNGFGFDSTRAALATAAAAPAAAGG